MRVVRVGGAVTSRSRDMIAEMEKVRQEEVKTTAETEIILTRQKPLWAVLITLAHGKRQQHGNNARTEKDLKVPTQLSRYLGR